MKKFILHTKFHRIKKSSTFILYVFMLLHCAHIYSQQPTQYVVRFNHLLLNHKAIDNPDLLNDKFSSFLNATGKKVADSLKKTGLDIEDVFVRKLFPNWVTTDTVSISRQGSKVYPPPFWATFLVSVPEDTHPLRFFETMQKAQP